ncbi:hypothetical protein MMPV_009454, partial [Pyropia vietnamensis]
MYGSAEARKIGRKTRDMKHSFAGYPPFRGKEPLRIFAWLRKFVKAYNDSNVSEGMALHAASHFMTGDAEVRYTKVLSDSAGIAREAKVDSYPEAINWLLSTYAEPHTLALAQETFSRATKEPDEPVKAFASRLRAFSKLCGNILSERTLKQQLIQGVPEYVRTDAFVFNTPSATYQQLATYTAGKVNASQDVARLGQRILSRGTYPLGKGPRRSDPLSGSRRGAERDDDFVGHMAHDCQMLTAAQREKATKARELFVEQMRHLRGNPREATSGQSSGPSARVMALQAIYDGMEVLGEMLTGGGTQPTPRTVLVLRKKSLEVDLTVQDGPRGTSRKTTGIVDTGAGPSAIREDLLPEGWVQEADRPPKSTRVCDVSGQLLRTRGVVTLTVYADGTPMVGRFLVVKALSVPLILGMDFQRTYVKAIFPPTDTVIALMNLDDASVTRMYLANITPRPVNVPKGFSIGHVELYDGPGVAVPAEGEQPLEERAAEKRAVLNSPSPQAKADAEGSAPTGPTSAESEATSEPDVAWSRRSPDLQARVRSLLERFKSLWTGSLGRVK